MQDIIFVSMENWDDVWRRNQFLCAAYAKRHPEAKILFVGLPRDQSHAIRRGKWSEMRRSDDWTPPGLPNITITRPPKMLPNSLMAGRRFNEWLMRSHIHQKAQGLGLQSPLLWLNPHSAVHLVGRMGERAALYDITDDWISLTQSARLTRLIETQDAELCRKADAVIVCSEKLYAMKQGLTSHLHLIPNGVDAEHYARVQNRDLPLPASASEWSRPVFGYTGTIHPDRVDVPLVEQLARSLSAGSVVLIGPNHLRTEDQARLDTLPNVFLPGPVPYTQLPDYMRAFDVCITPHRVTPFTESLNPIKLWEYLAAGKPIVSTNVAGFRDYPQFVQIADADGFNEAVQNALHEDLASAEARRAEARFHSWSARLDAVEAVISDCLNGARKAVRGPLGA
jgi:teichuronic acid biosynthesis glycosyltransferase TuaH